MIIIRCKIVTRNHIIVNKVSEFDRDWKLFVQGKPDIELNVQNS